MCLLTITKVNKRLRYFFQGLMKHSLAFLNLKKSLNKYSLLLWIVRNMLSNVRN